MIELGPALIEFRPIRWSSPDQIRWFPGQICRTWSVWAKFGVDVGPSLDDFGPNSVDSGPILEERSRCRAKFGRFRADSWPSVVDSGHSWVWSILSRSRSIPGRSWPNSSESGACWARTARPIDRDRLGFGQIMATSTRLGPISARMGQRSEKNSGRRSGTPLEQRNVGGASDGVLVGMWRDLDRSNRQPRPS